MKEKEKSVFAWLMDFASVHKNLYVASVIMATLGVLCSIVPYCIMGDMLTKLIDGNKDWAVYLKEGLVMTAFWMARVIFHGISTTCSHKATFHVLGNIRKRVEYFYV